jgi:hypothetical protein
LSSVTGRYMHALIATQIAPSEAPSKGSLVVKHS